MQDEHDEKKRAARAAVAQRQAEFKRRQRLAGLRQVTVWVNDDSWNFGFAAAQAGQPATPVPPEAVDAWSWYGGWLDGDRKRQKSFAAKDF